MLITGDERSLQDGFELRYITFLVSEHIKLIYLEITGDGEISIAENVHDEDYELDISPSGEATIVVEGAELTSSPTQLVLIRPGARHHARLRVARLFQGYSLFIARQLLGAGPATTQPYALVGDAHKRLQRLFGLVNEHFIATPSDSAAGSDDFVLDVLQLLVTELRRGTLDAHLPENLQKLLALMHRSFAERLTLDDLAQEAATSKYHLVRRFKEIVGAPPMQYLTDLRLRKAVEKLRQEPHCNIAEVAFSVGFNDVSGFNRQFKRRYSVSPAAYRRQLSS